MKKIVILIAVIVMFMLPVNSYSFLLGGNMVVLEGKVRIIDANFILIKGKKLKIKENLREKLERCLFGTCSIVYDKSKMEVVSVLPEKKLGGRQKK
jgi:hypothetical protein